MSLLVLGFNWVYVFIFIVFLFGNFQGGLGGIILAFILFCCSVFQFFCFFFIQLLAFLISLTFWAKYKFMARAWERRREWILELDLVWPGLQWSQVQWSGVEWSNSLETADRGRPQTRDPTRPINAGNVMCGVLCNSPWEHRGSAIAPVSPRFRWQPRIERFNRRLLLNHCHCPPPYYLLHVHRTTYVHTSIIDPRIGFPLSFSCNTICMLGSALISRLCAAFGVWKLLQSLINSSCTWSMLHDPHGWTAPRSIIRSRAEPLNRNLGAWPIAGNDWLVHNWLSGKILIDNCYLFKSKYCIPNKKEEPNL